MAWLQRHAWWGLLAVSVTLILFGVTDMASGARADALIPQGLTGKSIEELEAESADAFGLFDFISRSNGWSLVLLGALLAVIVLVPFRSAAASDGRGGPPGRCRSGPPLSRSSTWWPASTPASRRRHRWSQAQSWRSSARRSSWSRGPGRRAPANVPVFRPGIPAVEPASPGGR